MYVARDLKNKTVLDMMGNTMEPPSWDTLGLGHGGRLNAFCY